MRAWREQNLLDDIHDAAEGRSIGNPLTNLFRYPDPGDW